MTRPDEDFLLLDDHLDPAERDLEAPTADAVEQATPANPTDTPDEPRLTSEATEYDALEQALVVELDDDYR